ncbi:MAG: hypothetical protein MI739_05095 [Bacteroidales bacterium]|nr:hypothetical protein [Bacteroidales bacterium]
MKKLIYLLSVLFLFSACKEETNEISRLKLKNCTDGEMQVILYPKAEYMQNGLYQFSYSAGYRETTFTISKNDDFDIYTSSDFNTEGPELLSQVFDSVRINIQLDGPPSILFTPNNADGYSMNPFTSDNSWSMSLIELDFPTNGSTNKTTSREFVLNIIPDNLLFKN